MNPLELLKFLEHIIVWIPHNNYIRSEIQQHIDNLKSQLNR